MMADVGLFSSSCTYHAAELRDDTEQLIYCRAVRASAVLQLSDKISDLASLAKRDLCLTRQILRMRCDALGALGLLPDLVINDGHALCDRNRIVGHLLETRERLVENMKASLRLLALL